MEKQLPDEEFDDLICKSFPLLYADRKGSPQETAMCWGFDILPGWQQLIWNLSDRLETAIKRWCSDNPESSCHPTARQVKQKFGELRFYMNFVTDEINQLIDETTTKSAHTCEYCGADDAQQIGPGWIITTCNSCRP